LVLAPAEEAARSEAASIRRYLMLPTTCEYRGFRINVDALDGSDQSLFDEGDLLPEWAFYWLKLCAAILQRSATRGGVRALLVPSRKFVAPLTVEDLCAEIASNAWKSEAEVFMIWGAEATLFKRPSFPIRCARSCVPDFRWLWNRLGRNRHGH
jgi:hypothetical protein